MLPKRGRARDSPGAKLAAVRRPARAGKKYADAFRGVRNAGETPRGEFHLLVIGDGPQREHLQNLAETNAGGDMVPYCADADELAHYYRAADLFVHPGMEETFGLVALESQACGTPVVGIRGS